MDISISPISRKAAPVEAPVRASGPQPKEVTIELAAAPAIGGPQSEEYLAQRVEEMNRAVKAADDHLQFEVHKGTNRVLVRLVDSATDEVVREFPSEKFLDLVAELQRIAGIHVDVKR